MVDSNGIEFRNENRQDAVIYWGKTVGRVYIPYGASTYTFDHEGNTGNGYANRIDAAIACITFMKTGEC